MKINTRFLGERLLLTLTAVNVVFIGFFGVFKYAQAVVFKNKAISDLQQLEKNLSQKQLQVEGAKQDFNTVAAYAPSFNAVIASTKNIQNYLSNFIENTSSSGFSITSFTPSAPDASGNVLVDATFAGETYEIHKLIQAIESTKRLTKLNSVSISEDNAYVNFLVLGEGFYD